jgi:hypothetical protein
MSKHPINIDSEILGGTPVFAGTRVPVESGQSKDRRHVYLLLAILHPAVVSPPSSVNTSPVM